MRDALLILATAGFLPICLRFPASGAICWAWFSIMSPHRQVWSFALGQPFNSVIAGATLIGWMLSRERKHWTSDLMPWLMLTFVLWMSFNSLFAPYPDWSWKFWDRTMRTLALVFLAFFLANNKARLQGFVWILVISLGYYGVKGGAFTISQGGVGVVYGPEDSIVRDNNQLAAAIVMVLPLVLYLRMHTKMKLLQFGLAVAIGLLVIMVFGSNSRGGVLALAATLLVFVSRTRNKMLYIVGGAVVLGVVLYFMPQSFWDRMNTVNSLDDDSSFQGRLMAWQVATAVAIDRFPFGAGFYAPQLSPIFNSYFPGASTHAAHSIYFQVLGEHGFIGLALYLAILLLGLRNSQLIRKQTRGRPELLWAYDLASMTQVAIIGFCIGGAALSMAYFDGFMLLMALLSCLREVIAPQVAPQLGQQKYQRFRFGASTGVLAPAGAGGPSWRASGNQQPRPRGG